jgi:hypothetical protein
MPDHDDQKERSEEMTRAISHISLAPMPGDVIELHEPDGGEVMLRVIAFVEDHVALKEYGRGRFFVPLSTWQQRIKAARYATVIRPGDHDVPF